MSALPKLNATPKHEMVVPSTGKTVMFRPYLVKEEKILLMAFETKDEKTAMQAMLDTIDACVEGEYVKSKLTTFDIEYMFTQIRGKSVGESVNVNLICQECKTKNEMNINLSELTIDVPKNVESTVELTDTISVELQYPPFKTFIDNFKEGIQETQFGFMVIRECFSAVISDDERIDVSEVSAKEIDDFIDSMTSDQIKLITDFVDTIPSLEKEVKYDCSNCGHHNELKLKGIQDFFT